MIYITLRVMMALNYLHSKNVVFMDLKPQNILIFRDWQVKLGDFGGAIRIRNNDIQEYNVHCYTAKFASKEFLEKVTINRQKLSKKELIEHDYYTLWKTFSYLKEQLIEGNILKPLNKFDKLVNDLKDFSVPLE